MSLSTTSGRSNGTCEGALLLDKVRMPREASPRPRGGEATGGGFDQLWIEAQQLQGARARKGRDDRPSRYRGQISGQ